MASSVADRPSCCNSLDCLEYAHKLKSSHIYPLCEGTCRAALQAGSAACLIYAHNNGAPLPLDTCTVAAALGHKDCLLYAHSHGCDLGSRSCAAAAENGNLECLEYAIKHSYLKPKIICWHAAQAENSDCLEYVHQQGFPWDARICEVAALHSRIPCLRYAHDHGCEWTRKTCIAAAKKGSLECLAYAHEQGCHWDANVLYVAAENGHFDSLEYAYANGCPFPVKNRFAHAAVRGGSLQCLTFVVNEMKCLWDPIGSEWKEAFTRGHCEMLEYIFLHGGVVCAKAYLHSCPELETHGNFNDVWRRRVGTDDRRVRCLLYLHCFYGMELPLVWHTDIGKLALGLLYMRQKAVLLCFQRAHAEHAFLQGLPSELVRQIVCDARLQPPGMAI